MPYNPNDEIYDRLKRSPISFTHREYSAPGTFTEVPLTVVGVNSDRKGGIYRGLYAKDPNGNIRYFWMDSRELMAFFEDHKEPEDAKPVPFTSHIFFGGGREHCDPQVEEAHRQLDYVFMLVGGLQQGYRGETPEDNEENYLKDVAYTDTYIRGLVLAMGGKHLLKDPPEPWKPGA